MSAPTIPQASVAAVSLISTVDAASATFNSSVPKLSAPNLTLGSISSPNINVNSVTDLSLGGISSNLNIQSPNLSDIGVPAVNLPPLQLPQIPSFPGIDMAGINLGAGPKFVANTLLKYKTIVPPFVPGLKINIGMVGAAISIVKAASSGNIEGLLNSLTSNLVENIKDQTGISSIQSQLDQAKDASVLGDLQSKYDSYQASVVENTQSTIDSAQGVVTNQINGGQPNS